jgi:hypothetical protein
MSAVSKAEWERDLRNIQKKLQSSILRPNQKDGGDTTLIFFLSFFLSLLVMAACTLSTPPTLHPIKLCPKFELSQFVKLVKRERESALQ